MPGRGRLVLRQDSPRSSRVSLWMLARLGMSGILMTLVARLGMAGETDCKIQRHVTRQHDTGR